MIAVESTSRGLIFTVHVLPRSSRSVIVGEHQGGLKIKLKAPPVEGAANKECLRLLAKTLGLPKSALAIVAGKSSRRKRICILSESTADRPMTVAGLRKTLQGLGQNNGQNPLDSTG